MSGLLASDDNNPEFMGARDPDSVLSVTFYMKAVKNNFESAKQNRPIFDDRLFVRIVPPGDGQVRSSAPGREIPCCLAL